MPTSALVETSAGFAVLKLTDKKLLGTDGISDRLSTLDKINQEVKFKHFAKFESAAEALEEIAGINEGKVTPKLASLLNEFKDDKKISLAVADKNLANAISKLPDLNIKPIVDSSTQELFRAVRQYLSDLIPGTTPETFQEMGLGLSHSLSRHKLKFSADKVDVMVVHAISILDETDKELNTVAMRVKEWYGWHFPELAKILNDNLAYARVIVALGLRSNAVNADLSEILPEEIETAVKAAADISMGTEISEEDLDNITLLAKKVIQLSDHRIELSNYLEERMKALSPNMTEIIGYLVGARLLAHSGSMMNLAKSPGSTIQILGAEKALFRALKTKNHTPKYGLIYHSSLVGQASGKNKGKIARQLASKVALSVRNDALGEIATNNDLDDDERTALGVKSRLKLENSLRILEGRPITSKSVSVGPNGIPLGAPSKWDIKEARKYNVDADGLTGNESAEADKPSRPLIQEVPEVEMANGDDEDEDEVAAEDRAGSPTLPSVSDDTDEELPTTADTKEAKKALKKQRKEQEKRRQDREERRTAKQEQEERREARAKTEAKASKGKATNGVSSTPAELSEEDVKKYAAMLDMSKKGFRKRFERGQITIVGGKPVDNGKDAAKASQDDDGTSKSSKRKHEEGDEAEAKPKKKKSKKDRKSEA